MTKTLLLIVFVTQLQTRPTNVTLSIKSDFGARELKRFPVYTNHLLMLILRLKDSFPNYLLLESVSSAFNGTELVLRASFVCPL
jgi:hypothetical protein